MAKRRRLRAQMPRMFFWTPAEQKRFSVSTERMQALVNEQATIVLELKTILGLVKAKRDRRRPPADSVNGMSPEAKGGQS